MGLTFRDGSTEVLCEKEVTFRPSPWPIRTIDDDLHPPKQCHFAGELSFTLLLTRHAAIFVSAFKPKFL